MKAATAASILALTMAGVACSERAPAENEGVQSAPVEQDTASASSASEFNLRYPGSETAAASDASSQFNLRIPDAEMDTGAVRLPEGAVRSETLTNVPEIESPPLPKNSASDEPEDEIIRLD